MIFFPPGKSLEDTLTIPVGGNHYKKTLNYGGKQYTSIKNFCRENNLAYEITVRKLKKGRR